MAACTVAFMHFCYTYYQLFIACNIGLLRYIFLLQVSAQKEYIDRICVEVNYQGKAGQSGCKDREKECFISNVCREIIEAKKHPRTHLLINIQEVHDDGGLLSCCINAAILALIDAGIPLKSLATAMTSCVLKDGRIQLDPTKEETEMAISSLTAAFECDNDRAQIVALKTSGPLNSAQVEDILAQMSKANKGIFHIIRTYISETYIAARM